MKNGENGQIPVRTIERLVVYRRALRILAAQGQAHVYSHDLAQMANNSAAQVRRDLMIIGYTGSPSRGYDVNDLLAQIGKVFGSKGEQRVALAGVGNLGHAILTHLGQRAPRLKIVALFDVESDKVGTSIDDCPCYHISDITKVVQEKRISIGMITVPAREAQHVADLMFLSGIRGILNFAPVRLKSPEHAFVDDVDIVSKLEKVAFFCDQGSELKC